MAVIVYLWPVPSDANPAAVRLRDPTVGSGSPFAESSAQVVGVGAIVVGGVRIALGGAAVTAVAAIGAAGEDPFAGSGADIYIHLRRRRR